MYVYASIGSSFRYRISTEKNDPLGSSTVWYPARSSWRPTFVTIPARIRMPQRLWTPSRSVWSMISTCAIGDAIVERSAGCDERGGLGVERAPVVVAAVVERHELVGRHGGNGLAARDQVALDVARAAHGHDRDLVERVVDRPAQCEGARARAGRAHDRLERGPGEDRVLLEAGAIGGGTRLEVEVDALALARTEVLGQVGAQLHQHDSAALEPGVELVAAAVQLRAPELLGLAEQVTAVDRRHVAVHVHRQHIEPVDPVVTGGHVDRPAEEVADAVGLPAADHRGDGGRVARLERRRQYRRHVVGVAHELHVQHLAVHEARVAQRVLDPGDLVRGLYEAHPVLLGQWCAAASGAGRAPKGRATLNVCASRSSFSGWNMEPSGYSTPPLKSALAPL